MGHENRDVPDQPDTPFGRALPKPRVLAEKEILRKTMILHRLRKAFAGFFHSVGIAMNKRGVPFGPGPSFVLVAQPPEQSGIFQPSPLFFAEPPVVVVRFEPCEGQTDQVGADGEGQAEIDAVARLPRRQIGKIGFVKQTLFQKRIGADQQRVPRKGRPALIGRIPVAGRVKRKHLPPPLARSGKEVEKLHRLRAKVAQAESTGKGCDVKQDSCGTFEHIGLLFVLCLMFCLLC